MYRISAAAAAASLMATSALAGGVERSTFSSAILFEEGSYGELSFGYVSPSVSGVDGDGDSSGNVFPSYTQWSLGFKTDVANNVAIAVILDQPIGANTVYPDGTDYPTQGFEAQLNNIGVTALAMYTTPSNISVYGGVRALQSSGDVSLGATGYTLDTSNELDFGYIVGVAWEKPEIAARVALTYISAITHDFASVEPSGTPGVPFESSFATTVPQTVKLEAQTGVAEDTLLFGSVQWTDWTAFDITPPAFALGNSGASLVDYDNDSFTYSLGVGRRFSDLFSGAVIATYEPSSGGQSGNLGPTDGRTSLALAGTYALNERVEINAGLNYTLVGDTFTAFGDFSGNSAVGAGVRIGMSF